MTENLSCVITYELKQETPIIHFQHNQSGATLRATEVKPKLDRFIIKKLGGVEKIDKSWFIVTDKSVTINEAKFEEVAAAIAPTVTSQITTVATSTIDGVTDCGREGDIMLEINTTGDTATARAWTQW